VDKALADLRTIFSREGSDTPLEAYVLQIEVHQRRKDVPQVIAAVDSLGQQFPGDPRAAAMLLRMAQSHMAATSGNAPMRLRFVRMLTERILSTYPSTPAAPAARRLQEQVDRRLGGRRD
jgi:hypothetical protein